MLTRPRRFHYPDPPGDRNRDGRCPLRPAGGRVGACKRIGQPLTGGGRSGRPAPGIVRLTCDAHRRRTCARARASIKRDLCPKVDVVVNSEWVGGGGGRREGGGATAWRGGACTHQRVRTHVRPSARARHACVRPRSCQYVELFCQLQYHFIVHHRKIRWN